MTDEYHEWETIDGKRGKTLISSDRHVPPDEPLTTIEEDARTARQIERGLIRDRSTLPVITEPLAAALFPAPDEAGDTPALHVYKVGMGSATALVEAPTPFAAALFYGASTNTNAPLATVVYEEDGKKYEGGQPWVSWQLNWQNMTGADQASAIAEIEKVTDTIPLCRFVEAEG